LRSVTLTPVVLIVVGAMLAVSSAIAFVPRLQKPLFAREKSHWLSFIAVPIGIETGFSSAGAGALGSMLLLNFSELSAAEVVGTDLLFGIVLAVVGSAFHLGWGTVDQVTLVRLLVGGVPGVLLGCLASRYVPGKRLRTAVAVVGLILALQLVFAGGKTLLQKPDVTKLEALRTR
jgi:uncharacterized membrane protein YfcA